ncbi:MAG: hypothetical protein KDC80_09680 [Saprospiraceae bacterium]|nr:hypothetical protein [Saprospiraceae bacterium]
MDLTGRTTQLFPPLTDPVIDERITTFLIRYDISQIPNLDSTLLGRYLSLIPDDDDFELVLKIEENPAILLSSKNEIDKFIAATKKEDQYFEQGENIKFSLLINKHSNDNVLNVYNLSQFQMFWRNIKSIDLLKALSPMLRNCQKIHFVIREPNFISFRTKGIHFSSDMQEMQAFDEGISNEEVHFGNYQDYPFAPSWFQLIKRPEENNPITDKLDILKALFSIISIFDITSIVDNKLHYKLTGYKTFEGVMEINKDFIKCSSTYYSLYDWGYSSKGNLTDKLGLIRNILSIYLNNNILELDKNILISIKSSYKTYLKENVGRYLEIRSKVFNELSWISQKSSEVVEKYLGNYQRSILTYVSFFVSVFILRILSTGNFVDVFSKDATILSFSFLAISAIFLIFSFWNLRMEKKRLNRKYNNIKSRYRDLLVEKDIDQILDDDKEFKYEMSFVENRLIIYTILWIVTLLVLFSAILTVSSYVNWETLF